jgi:hypothetical protein
MTLLDLSLVTRTLTDLIEAHVAASPVWPAGTTLTLSPEPPDKLKGDNVLGFYLYHVSEDAHFKNLPPPGNDQPPVRYVPMGLNLYYQLSAHSDFTGVTGVYREQLLLSCAVKALHDYPIIDDSTEIGGSKVMAASLRGSNNTFRITLQPIPYDQAVNYWTAGSTPLRLAAYYQVSVVLLEPEEPKSRAGRVLLYGVHTFAAGAPRLDGSRNVVSFTLPGETAAREIELRPAQAPPAPPLPDPPPAASRVTFTGTNLAGDRTSLLLKSARWEDLVEVGTAWSVAARENQLTAVVQQTADTEDVFPGVHSALVKVVRRRTMPDGKEREFEHVSNEAPFVVTPRIDKVAPTGASGMLKVTGYAFQHGTPPKNLRVQVYVGDSRLTERATGVPSAGEFAVLDAMNLRLRLPGGLSSGEWVPLRIFVEGAESPPEWIQVP